MDCKYETKNRRCGLIEGSYAYKLTCYTRDCCKCWEPVTNADRIRAMSDEELAELLCTADWCEACDQVKQDGTCHTMELGGPLNEYCLAGALNWLRQPAQGDG